MDLRQVGMVNYNKCDQILWYAFHEANNDDQLECVFILKDTSPTMLAPNIRRTDFNSVIEYRRALIVSRRDAKKNETSDIIDKLKKLRLSVSGGCLACTVVVRGRADLLLRGLRLDGVLKAVYNGETIALMIHSLGARLGLDASTGIDFKAGDDESTVLSKLTNIRTNLQNRAHSHYCHDGRTL